MKNGGEATRSPKRRIGVRVLHAHGLIVALERYEPEIQKQMREEIKAAAVKAVIAARCGPEIAYHPFAGAGRDLVLSSRWSQQRELITIEVDLRPAQAPAVTLVGALPSARQVPYPGDGPTWPARSRSGLPKPWNQIIAS
jgi:hypothetical protein